MQTQTQPEEQVAEAVLRLCQQGKVTEDIEEGEKVMRGESDRAEAPGAVLASLKQNLASAASPPTGEGV